VQSGGARPAPNAGNVNSTSSVFGPVLNWQRSSGHERSRRIEPVQLHHNFPRPISTTPACKSRERRSQSRISNWVRWVGGPQLNVVSTSSSNAFLHSLALSCSSQLGNSNTTPYINVQNSQLAGLTSILLTPSDTPWMRIASTAGSSWMRLQQASDYGTADFDTRHSFAASFTYAVPKAKWWPRIGQVHRDRPGGSSGVGFPTLDSRMDELRSVFCGSATLSRASPYFRQDDPMGAMDSPAELPSPCVSQLRLQRVPQEW